MAAVEFRFLGPVEAVRNGESLPLGGRRQRALLALLLLEPGQPATVDWLVEELWQGRPPAGAPATLRSYVSRLRNVLGAEVTLTGGAASYTLEVPRDRIDAHRFEELAREGEEALSAERARRAERRLRSALELWRARPFADVADEGALRLEAERLDRIRVRALEDRIEAELALGRGAELVEELEALVQENPYRERFWRQLMLALYRAERQADALEAYRRARAILDGELGLEPSEELRRLEQAILRHEVPPVAPLEERHNLPAAVTSFIGRAAELVEVARLLDEARFVTLTGVGGVGKTRLALEAAQRALADFADGVVFVDLAPLAEPELVVRHAATELGVEEHGDLPVDDQLRRKLRESELLLVLDNCEHLREAAAELVQLLLTACPELRVLATSRERLGVAGEVDYAVPPLTLPSAGADLEEVRSSEAVRLLLARVREARPRLDEDAALASAGGICRDLDGLPLAIELAAARAKALSLEEIAARLADRFRFLVSWRRLTTARHRTLRETMDWSYELLSNDEQALLARLSVFVGGFTLAAVATACLDEDEERALELVERLVGASLVISEERKGKSRYRLLETVREYAGERLEESEAAGDARRRHLLYFIEVAESADLRGPDQPHWVAVLDAELDNLRAALDEARAVPEAELELRLAGASWRYWWVRGYLEEGSRRINDVLERRGHEGGAALARVSNGGAGLAWSRGDYDGARALADAALEQAQASRAPLEEALARNLLGVTAMKQDEYETARRHLGASLELGEQLGLELDVVTAKLNLGVVALESGDTGAAVPFFEDVLDYHRHHGVAQGVGFASLNLGQARYRLGDPAAARKHFEEARTAFGSIGFRAHLAHALQGLAAVDLSVGAADEAARLLGRASCLLSGVGALAEDFDPVLAAEVEADARARLGEEVFAAAFEEGRRAEADPAPAAS